MGTLRDMHLNALGDCVILARVDAKTPSLVLQKAARLARQLSAVPLAGITDVVPSFETVAVHYDPAKVIEGAARSERITPFERVAAWIRSSAAQLTGGGKVAGREVTVPVCYGGEDGPDLGEVATRARLTEAEVAKLHSKTTYLVAAVGFSPGFPYLLGLAPKLATPRRATPRVSVPAGSVGIGGPYTGIYPTSSPGGWSIIGRTPLRLFRPEDEARPTLLEAGDVVRFRAVTPREAQKLQDSPVTASAPKTAKGAAVFEVLKPGTLTTVQDLGRAGAQHHGVSPGGAMDVRAARVANALLGNDQGAPLLEATSTGPEVRFLRDTWVAVTGAAVRDVPTWRPWRAAAGQVVSFAEISGGTRVYIAVAGGFDVPRVLGGAGTLARAGIGGWGGRALRTGDVLGAVPTELEITLGWYASPEFRVQSADEVEVRVVRGPQRDWFTEESRAAFLATPFEITPRSDRMGLRLSGPPLGLTRKDELASEGVSFGSVQVPPDGQPIVLMADRQTIGGYPKIAAVISVDLPRLAQAKSGGRVRFREVSLELAQRLWIEQERALGWLAAGARGKIRERCK